MILDKLLHKFDEKSLHTDTHFNSYDFTLTTTTSLLGKVVSTVSVDMTPMYTAFKDRLEAEWYPGE